MGTLLQIHMNSYNIQPENRNDRSGNAFKVGKLR